MLTCVAIPTKTSTSTYYPTASYFGILPVYVCVLAAVLDSLHALATYARLVLGCCPRAMRTHACSTRWKLTERQLLASFGWSCSARERTPDQTGQENNTRRG
jgi:hypothetical protein